VFKLSLEGKTKMLKNIMKSRKKYFIALLIKKLI